MIWAWIVTSRAVVGSSAMSSFGWQARAMAIITRWRMPPESSCGYWSTRFSGEGMPTRRSISTAFSRACAFFMPWWMRSVSMIWWPTVKTGFRELSASWKTMATSLPRTFCISFSGRRSRSLPAKRISPPYLTWYFSS